MCENQWWKTWSGLEFISPASIQHSKAKEGHQPTTNFSGSCSTSHIMITIIQGSEFTFMQTCRVSKEPTDKNECILCLSVLHHVLCPGMRRMAYLVNPP